MEQKPSIGRIVHVLDNANRVCAAIITKVHSETCVNLVRIEGIGNLTPMSSCELVSTTLEHQSQWLWPPRV
jgi:hypothetical protein